MKKNDFEKLQEIMNTIHDKTTYTFIDPRIVNRWTVEISEIKIKPYLFQSISVPTIRREKSNWRSYKNPSIEPVIFSLIETVNTNHYRSFIEFLRDSKVLTIWIKYLDPTGAEISKVLLEKCKVIEVSQSPLTYEKDDVIKTFVTIKPLSVKFSK